MVSIYLDPDRQGQGIGVSALLAAIVWLRDLRPSLRQIEAIVLVSNSASYRLFPAAGFVPIRTNYGLDWWAVASPSNLSVGQRLP